MFKIERASDEDILELTQLWHELICYHNNKSEKYEINKQWQKLKVNELKWIINSNNNIIYIAKISGFSLGYIRGSIKKLPDIYNEFITGNIEEIYVLNQYRNVGIGGLLVAEIKDYFTKNKVHFIDIHVDKTNIDGDKFWGIMGFEDVSIKKRLYI